MAQTSTKPRRLPALAVEFKDLVVTYAKEQTLEPIKGLGRFIAMGVAGSLLMAVGLVLLVLGLLRGLQGEFAGVFDGNWSWVPYGVTLVACLVVLGLSIRAVGAARRRRPAQP
ncbi:MAG: hypothetical protein ACRD0M_12810 [Acidimicrobiales bacterium]